MSNALFEFCMRQGEALREAQKSLKKFEIQMPEMPKIDLNLEYLYKISIILLLDSKQEKMLVKNIPNDGDIIKSLSGELLEVIGVYKIIESDNTDIYVKVIKTNKEETKVRIGFDINNL